MMWQVVNFVVSKMRPLDVQLRAEGADEDTRHIVSE